MEGLREEVTLRNKAPVVTDRAEAGRRLAGMLEEYRESEALVLAIPAGGVPVAAEIARELHLPLDLLIVRKVQIPWNTEAGFGAVDPDGEVLLNEHLLAHLHLSPAQVAEQIEKTRENLKQRDATFRGGRPFPEVKGRTLILVDDGLASGYTMLAALGFLKRREAGEVVVAVPTALLATARKVLAGAQAVVCLNIREHTPFAVAAAYRNWYDVSDKEVLKIFQETRKATAPA